MSPIGPGRQQRRRLLQGGRARRRHGELRGKRTLATLPAAPKLSPGPRRDGKPPRRPEAEPVIAPRRRRRPSSTSGARHGTARHDTAQRRLSRPPPSHTRRGRAPRTRRPLVHSPAHSERSPGSGAFLPSFPPSLAPVKVEPGLLRPTPPSRAATTARSQPGPPSGRLAPPLSHLGPAAAGRGRGNRGGR